MYKIQLVGFAAQFVSILGKMIYYAIIARILVSWFSMGRTSPNNKFFAILIDITDPVINLARKIPHKIGMLDFAPLIAMIAVDLFTTLIIKLILALV